MRPFAPTILGALALLSGCSAETTDSSAPEDTSAVEDTSGSEETGDTSAPPETVPVTYSVWTPESGCWAVETADLAYDYWWPYGPESGVACNDVAWYLVDGERCLLFSYECTETNPASDPAFGGTAEEEAACVAVVEATEAGEVPSCP